MNGLGITLTKICPKKQNNETYVAMQTCYAANGHEYIPKNLRYRAHEKTFEATWKRRSPRLALQKVNRNSALISTGMHDYTAFSFTSLYIIIIIFYYLNFKKFNHIHAVSSCIGSEII